jgi:pentatricopeptide repeat protein
MALETLRKMETLGIKPND